ncbi:Exopolysaccharide synthesis, ExoD [Jannaschia seosinensis]|uniref:Exopolysaccharide synthesis, ExoD n=1 Tax=Jannaschia seosinensis TaxID=313367 RepID=A0A0M7B6H6_9RHOB|nr:exopolysaccharide biosynthesis protein [Jannaschia seosinensis]CUH35128.1 Exopolysaccharide synthesis, ExoD [Jannaschia seosinensis]
MPQDDRRARPISAILTELAARSDAGREVRLGSVAARIGSRGHGMAILILALPETIPAPVPGLSGILGVPLLLISLHLAAFGEGSHLPRRAARLRVPPRLLAVAARYGAPVLRRAERVTAPRLAPLVRRERMVGAVGAVWSLVLWLPIPFLNVPPATLLILLAWGLIQRDGLFILLALIGSVLLTGAIILAGGAVVEALSMWL